MNRHAIVARHAHKQCGSFPNRAQHGVGKFPISLFNYCFSH